MSTQNCQKTILVPIAAGATSVEVPYPAGATGADASTPVIIGPAGVGVSSVQFTATHILVYLSGSPAAFGTHQVSTQFEWHCDADHWPQWQGGCDSETDCEPIRACISGGDGIDYDPETGIITATGTCQFTVNAGLTADANDASLGTATIDCGEIIHFHSPDGLVTVSEGSAVIRVDHPDLCAFLDELGDTVPLNCAGLPPA